MGEYSATPVFTHDSDPGSLWRGWWRLRGKRARSREFQQLLLGNRPLAMGERMKRMRGLLGLGLGENPTSARENSLEYAMHKILERGDHSELIDLGLKAGANPNDREPDHYFDTLLTKAVRRGRVQCIRTLLEHEADPSLIEGTGQCALNLAIDVWAIDHANPAAAILALIEGGASLDSPGHKRPEDNKIRFPIQAPPLLWAIASGRLGAADILLKAGANINVVDKKGCGIVHLAPDTGMLSWGASKGANLHLKNNEGMNGFDLAVTQGRLDMAAHLAKAGVDIENRQCYHLAAGAEQRCERGASVMHFLALTDEKSNTEALLDAIEARHPDCWTWTDDEGRTAFQALLDAETNGWRKADPALRARAEMKHMESKTAVAPNDFAGEQQRAPKRAPRL